MKKKGKREKIWRLIILFLAFQIGCILLFRTCSSLTSTSISPDHKRRGPKERMRSASSSPISLLPLDNEQNSLSSPPKSMFLSSQTRHLSVHPKPTKPTIVCDRTHELYDWCHLKTPAILDPKTATFFPRSTPSSYNIDPPLIEKVRPYPRKRYNDTMSHIREITLSTERPLPELSCAVIHDTPALVFSIGGFTGNFFHDFNDGFVPLFVTLNTLFPEHDDITLVITDYSKWWYGKYEAMLPQFSRRQVINLDNQTAPHCFTSVAVGLITHGPMTINPALIPGQKKSFLDFRALLEEGYRKCLVWPAPKIKGRPRLVLVSRAGPVGRVILNQDTIIKAAQQEGFEVVVFEPSAFTYLCDVYRLINGSHALMGVHGAALTHALFLQPGAAFIQVVPLGGEWLAQTYFQNMARGMKLEYMEYKIEPKESTLAEKYGKNHILVKDSDAIASRNWTALHSIYLRSQDVNIDVARFRGFLKNAYSKAKKLMESQGLHVRRRPRIKKYIRPPVFSYTYGVG